MRILIILGVWLAGSVPVVSAEENLWGGAADPTTVAGRNGDTGYYTVATGKGARILHSGDLVNWKVVGRVFKENVPAWAAKAVPKSNGIWAPDISFHDGRYHLYYSVSSFGSQRSVIGLAVNKRLEPGHPDNKWEDRGLVIESWPAKMDFNAIDAALFVDDDGSWYLFFGSFWGGIKMVRLDPATGKPFPKTEEILPVATRAPEVPDRPIEAAYVIKREGWYYLFVSWDHCCNGEKSDYKVAVGRSKSVTGPFVDAAGEPMREGGGTVILRSDADWAGPGHNGVLQTKEKGDFMVHHAYRRGKVEFGRQLVVRPILWDEKGWPRVGDLINRPK